MKDEGNESHGIFYSQRPADSTVLKRRHIRWESLQKQRSGT